MPPEAGEVRGWLKRHGWEVNHVTGSHHQLEHPDRDDVVTVAGANSKELSWRIIESILKQAGFRSLADLKRKPKKPRKPQKES